MRGDILNFSSKEVKNAYFSTREHREPDFQFIEHLHAFEASGDPHVKRIARNVPLVQVPVVPLKRAWSPQIPRPVVKKSGSVVVCKTIIRLTLPAARRRSIPMRKCDPLDRTEGTSLTSAPYQASSSASQSCTHP